MRTFGSRFHEEVPTEEAVDTHTERYRYIDIALPVGKWARPEKLGERFYMKYSYHES